MADLGRQRSIIKRVHCVFITVIDIIPAEVGGNNDVKIVLLKLVFEKL